MNTYIVGSPVIEEIEWNDNSGNETYGRMDLYKELHRFECNNLEEAEIHIAEHISKKNKINKKDIYVSTEYDEHGFGIDTETMNHLYIEINGNYINLVLIKIN